MRTVLIAGLVAGVYCAPAGDEGVMKLHMMPEKGLKGMGAVCLDGSDAGFYFAPAVDAANANNWQVYFQGGGWCYSEEDCLTRSETVVGSSKAWRTTSAHSGLMSSDCKLNPDFCKFNRVELMYCDGSSFSGNREDPLEVQGKQLYFRGRRIVDAVFDTLLTMGLKNATNVMLTGASAGGLATFLHTDYIHGRLLASAPNLQKFRSVPMSGFFLLHKTVEDKPVYPEQMKAMFELANSTAGVDSKCIAAKEASTKWMCGFAEHVYEHIEAPIFPVNSALDSFQSACIYTAELPDNYPHTTTNGNCSAAASWGPCGVNTEACTAKQIERMNQYMGDFNDIMQNAGRTYKKPGNGAFIHSCHTHGEAIQVGWNTIQVGGVSMQQAVSSWWHSPGDEPAATHSYQACRYDGGETPKQCNPSCFVSSSSANDPFLV
eukprot:TRINITY_DN111505_c0_g1_i1.p1 TRINITY_DN111505_c0_g1~~TRINITY_DN111505_c0_g1_i1.p1  ORF type:complete len:432 (-),score=79.13 TRINITY_DN111505_c0_g1_i1:258-1553(-)